MAAYVASKAGLEGLARAMQMEFEGTGVRVGIVRPGPSSTEQGTTWDEETVNEVVASWHRWGLMRHDGSLRPDGDGRRPSSPWSPPPGAPATRCSRCSPRPRWGSHT